MFATLTQRFAHWPATARRLAQLIGLIALALLPHLDHLPMWVVAAFLVTAGWRLSLELHARALPPPWLRNTLAFSLLLLLMGSLSGLNGFEAGTAVLSLMAGMKLLEAQRTRDQLALIFVALFLLFAALLYVQSLIILPYLLLCVLATLAVLMQVQMSMSSLSGWQTIKRSSRILLQALPLAAVLFVLVPRLPSHLWALPSRGGAITGLSDSMSPGDVANLSQSNEVAFRVSFAGEAPSASQRYWRAIVLSAFDGRTWTHQRSGVGEQPLQVGKEQYRYRMLLEPSNQPFVPALDVPIDSDLRRSVITDERQVLSFLPISSLTAIQFVSASTYRLNPTLTRWQRQQSTALPGQLNPRARTMAQQWRANTRDDSAYIRRVLNWIHTDQFYYTLSPPTLGVNSVDEFLFKTQRGFCEHYASALTFLLRAADIPARVVTGYQGGEYNPVSKYWVIRQADAHAWVEAWLPERGWIRIDPTSVIAPERIEQGMAIPDGANDRAPARILEHSGWLLAAAQRWDAVNTFWKERIVNFDRNDQRNLLARMGIHDDSMRTFGIAIGLSFVAFFLALSSYLAWRHRPARLAPEVILWRTLTQKLAKLGIAYQPHEGPVDYLQRATQTKPEMAATLQQIGQLYVALRYEPNPSPQLLASLKALIKQLA